MTDEPVDHAALSREITGRSPNILRRLAEEERDLMEAIEIMANVLAEALDIGPLPARVATMVTAARWR